MLHNNKLTIKVTTFFVSLFIFNKLSSIILSFHSKKRSISVELLRQLYNYKVPSAQQKYKDYFFLIFFLIGINVKDLLYATKTQIKCGRLEYIREKTGKKYSIKIEPEAEQLIAQHSGSKFLLNALDTCKLYKSFARKINSTMQSIGIVEDEIIQSDDLFCEPIIRKKIIPLVPEITTYYARHTWATLAYEIGIQIDVISQALGHSLGNKTTLIYIKTNQSKVDEANRKVIDYLLGKTITNE